MTELKTNPTEHSCGILLWREGKRHKKNKRNLEVFLIKPNNPAFWDRPTSRDVWGIPKGKKNRKETPEQAAWREFKEETGWNRPIEGKLVALPEMVTFGGKLISIYAVDAGKEAVVWKSSNTQTSTVGGVKVTYAETIAGAWFPFEVALRKIGHGQKSILQALKKTALH